MAANTKNEKWYVKENGGKGKLVGIASTRSNWFVAEEMLKDNAELVCKLFNDQADDIKDILKTPTNSAMVPCLAYKERFKVCDHAVVCCNDKSDSCEHKSQHQ